MMQIQSLTTPTSRLMRCQSAANDTDYIPQNPLPSVFLVEQGVEYNQFGFSVGLCPRQALCPSLAYLLWGTEWRKKVLLSSSQNTCVLSALLWSQIQNTAPSLEHELHGSRTQGTHSLHLASTHLLCVSSCWYGWLLSSLPTSPIYLPHHLQHHCPFFQLFSEILYCLCFSPFCFFSFLQCARQLMSSKLKFGIRLVIR